MYTVTRQLQWPTGEAIVEISYGGIDYTNPDALCAKYDGEFCEYHDPREAVQVTISILKAWRKDGKKKAMLGIGNTFGMTMPFDSCTIKEARKWARDEYNSFPKCDECGGLITGDAYTMFDDPCERNFCSEYCAEKAIDWEDDENEEMTRV